MGGKVEQTRLYNHRSRLALLSQYNLVISNVDNSAARHFARCPEDGMAPLPAPFGFTLVTSEGERVRCAQLPRVRTHWRPSSPPNTASVALAELQATGNGVQDFKHLWPLSVLSSRVREWLKALCHEGVVDL